MTHTATYLSRLLMCAADLQEVPLHLQSAAHHLRLQQGDPKVKGHTFTVLNNSSKHNF